MRERGNISARISVHWRAQCHAKWPSSQCSKTMLPLVGVGATKILDSFIIWFSKRFGIWKEFFRSFLDQFVSDLDRLSVLSIFKFDPVWFMSCSTTIFNGQCCLSVCEHSRLENLCRFWIKKRLLKLDCWFNGGSRQCCSVSSVQTLDHLDAMFGVLFLLFSLFSPALDAVEVALKD